MYDERGHKLFIPSIYTFKYLTPAAAPASSLARELPTTELKVNPLSFAFVKCSSIMTFPARLKSHSALNVYFPIGESLLM